VATDLDGDDCGDPDDHDWWPAREDSDMLPATFDRLVTIKALGKKTPLSS
jgi:hypothetical protein